MLHPHPSPLPLSISISLSLTLSLFIMLLLLLLYLLRSLCGIFVSAFLVLLAVVVVVRPVFTLRHLHS